MSELMVFYPEIKQAHIAAVMCSGAVFGVRALALLAGMHWPRAAMIRYTSYGIDSILLTLALILLGLLPTAMFANGWLWMKLTCVLVYIILGIIAFRPQRKPFFRALLIVAAGCCFLQAYGIARAHHPLGWILWLS